MGHLVIMRRVGESFHMWLGDERVTVRLTRIAGNNCTLFITSEGQICVRRDDIDEEDWRMLPKVARCAISRRLSEAICIKARGIVVEVAPSKINRSQVAIAIKAPRRVTILRAELLPGARLRDVQ